MVPLYPGVERAPYDDNYHKAQTVCSTVNKQHHLRAKFCRYIFSSEMEHVVEEKM